jgi:diguanylate cyclase (GGDEF)-like protein
MSHRSQVSVAAFVEVVDSVLCAREFNERVELDDVALQMTELAGGTPADKAIPLDVLASVLAEAGAAAAEVSSLLIFLRQQLEPLGIEVELPGDAGATTASPADEPALPFDMPVLTGEGAPLDELRAAPVPNVGPTWPDETPAVSIRAVRVADPTTQTPSLLVISGASLGQSFPLSRGRAVIGRSSRADIVLEDHGVSRQHVEVVRKGKSWMLRDLGSRNGVFVNGLGVSEHELEEGDRIQVGSTAILKYVLQDEIEKGFQEQLLESLSTDGGTGAYNRRFFMQRLRIECAYARRHQVPLTMLFFDLDHFKQVNDSYGHLAGDAVLAEFVTLAKDALRLEDLVARYGGEEFAVLLRGTPEEPASLVAERIRHGVADHPFEHEGQRMKVTVSIGVASLVPNKRDTPLELVQAADEALYAAKSEGRNRVARAPAL